MVSEGDKLHLPLGKKKNSGYGAKYVVKVVEQSCVFFFYFSKSRDSNYCELCEGIKEGQTS